MPIQTKDAENGESEGDLVSTSVKRREDRHLITGNARYADDIQYPNGVHLAIHRSRYGHARIEGIDTSSAEAMDGVLAVYTREDLVEADIDPTLPGDDYEWSASAHRPLLADNKVRFQGQPIAAVVAEDRYTAGDAVQAIDVDYDSLDAVTDLESAVGPDAPTLHESAPDNVAFEWETGDAEGTKTAFEDAADVVELDLSINRVAGVPMEPRAGVARWEGDQLVVELSAQGPHGIQDDLADILGIPENRITVKVPDVGGGFGVKGRTYAGPVLAAWATGRIKRPVSFTTSRTESFQSTNHARRQEVTARAALNEEGRIKGLHVKTIADAGAYLTGGGAVIPTFAFGTRLLGQYDIDNAHVEVTGAFTNTVPTSAYRGAGRPEAAYVIERLVEHVARESGEDRLEFRRKNFIDPNDFPYETPFGSTYDSGDYEGALDKALEHVDIEEFRERQVQARKEGRYLGIGFSTYIEICGGGSGSIQGGLVRMTPSGKVVAHTGTVEIGGGHQTSYAQIVADELGVPYDDVEIVEGDTSRVPEGAGTFGSRSMTMGGNALRASARKVRERARQIAANELEVSTEDVEFDDGEFHVKGAPKRSVGIGEIAQRAYSGKVPEDIRGLEDTTFFSPEGSTAPFGTHVCVVEVDPESGAVEIERYVAVDDVGTQINPKLVEGQIVGGVVQSIGQALLEDAKYDDQGNLLTGSLQDYALPRAFDVPEIEWDSTVTPSPNNPLGVKGVGEAGTIAAMPAIVNATIDALEPFGVDTLDMPLTDQSVWRAIHED
ncbi:MAG: xanthine dehydrogenase family protein molybdopterin-binding subunit [Halobacteria archaeon]|nr:xanthine dehydrogenase family protein molybdopterin-binding subunit [Halobacteria archaeon]